MLKSLRSLAFVKKSTSCDPAAECLLKEKKSASADSPSSSISLVSTEEIEAWKRCNPCIGGDGCAAAGKFCPCSWTEKAIEKSILEEKYCKASAK